MRLLGSTSSLKRTFKCPASNVLAEKEEETSVSDAADRGRKIHAYLEYAPDDMKKATELADNRIQTCKKIDIKETAGYYVSMDYRELRMSYQISTDTARIIPKTDNDRDYGDVADDEVPGTADVVIPGWYSFEVVDYKTGKHPVYAENNEQLTHLAMMTHMTVAPKARVCYVSIQQLKGHGKWKNSTAKLDIFDFEEHKEKLNAAYDKAKKYLDIVQDGGMPPVNEGDWCFFCPSKSVCPAWK